MKAIIIRMIGTEHVERHCVWEKVHYPKAPTITQSLFRIAKSTVSQRLSDEKRTFHTPNVSLGLLIQGAECLQIFAVQLPEINV